MSQEYTAEEIIKGLLGDKSLQEIIQLILVKVAKQELRMDSLEETIDAIIEEIDNESE
jgi:hypothetical protein